MTPPMKNFPAAKSSAQKPPATKKAHAATSSADKAPAPRRKPPMKSARTVKLRSKFINKRGKIVSKKASAAQQRAYQDSTFKVWSECVQEARGALGLDGFVPINGATAEGKALYVKAKAMFASRK